MGETRTDHHNVTEHVSLEIDAGRKFNDAVSATGVVGGIRSDLKAVQDDVTEIKSDVKALSGDVRSIRSTMDRYGGAMVVVGSIISIATTLVVTVAGKAILGALGL